eukprot:3446593-Pleurochrysis_carterae.AAC.3
MKGCHSTKLCASRMVAVRLSRAYTLRLVSSGVDPFLDVSCGKTCLRLPFLLADAHNSAHLIARSLVLTPLPCLVTFNPYPDSRSVTCPHPQLLARRQGRARLVSHQLLMRLEMAMKQRKHEGAGELEGDAIGCHVPLKWRRFEPCTYEKQSRARARKMAKPRHSSGS